MIFKHFNCIPWFIVGIQILVDGEISQDTESPGQYYVVYKCEDGAIWSRPYGMLVGKVDRKKYPDADQEYRFEEVQNGNQK